MRLFDDDVYEAEIVNVSTNAQGTVTVFAEVRLPCPGYMVAVTTHGRSLITIDLPGARRQYMITYDDGAGAYRAHELELDESPLALMMFYFTADVQQLVVLGLDELWSGLFTVMPANLPGCGGFRPPVRNDR